MTQHRSSTVAALRSEVLAWQRRAFISWLALFGIVLATCANYTATDDLVARRKLTVGDSGATVHVENGVVTVTGTDGGKAVLSSAGLTVTKAGAK